MARLVGDRILLWIWRLSLAAAILVGALSWKNGSVLAISVLRAIVTFGVIYAACMFSVGLLEKSALNRTVVQRKFDLERGALFDVAVGLDGDRASQKGNIFPQQVEPSLSSGLPDEERQADIVRRMGWADEGR